MLRRVLKTSRRLLKKFSFFSEKEVLEYKDEFLFWMNGGAKLTNQRPVSRSLNLRKNNKIADKTRWISLRIFLGFCRGLLIKAKRLSYRLYNPVVWEPQKFTFIQNKKKTRLCILCNKSGGRFISVTFLDSAKSVCYNQLIETKYCIFA